MYGHNFVFWQISTHFVHFWRTNNNNTNQVTIFWLFTDALYFWIVKELVVMQCIQVQRSGKVVGWNNSGTRCLRSTSSFGGNKSNILYFLNQLEHAVRVVSVSSSYDHNVDNCLNQLEHAVRVVKEACFLAISSMHKMRSKSTRARGACGPNEQIIALVRSTAKV